MAERLGRGLQNLVQRFESARDLHKAHFQWAFLLGDAQLGITIHALSFLPHVSLTNGIYPA